MRISTPLTFVWALAVLPFYCAFAAASSRVVELDEKTFDTSVLDSPAVWIIGFYATSSAAASIKPAFDKAAEALDGVVHFGTVDMEKHLSLASTYGASKTDGVMIKMFTKDKSNALSYSGALNGDDLVDTALDAVQGLVHARLGRTHPAAAAPEKKNSNKEKKKKKKNVKAVVELTDNTFDELVFSGENDLYMVAFVAPWCGHCKALIPEWKEAATQLVGTGVTLATVDATQNEALAQRFQVKGYPTIKVFTPGRSDDSDAEDYQGERTAGPIADYALQTFEARGGSVHIEIAEITSEDALDELCEKGRCAIAFLPDLRDSMKDGRDKYLELLVNVAKRHRASPIGWMEAGIQTAWEEKYELTFGFPALVYLRKSAGKELGFVYRGKFIEDDVGAFLNARKSLGLAVEGWADVVKANAWDGKDPLPSVQEDDDFDLDAFLNDED